MTDASISRDEEDFLAKVRRSNAETEKFIEEAFKLRAEEAKLRAEEAKLRAEEGKLGRDRALSPWQLMLTMVAAGTGLFASGATIFKLFGH